MIELQNHGTKAQGRRRGGGGIPPRRRHWPDSRGPKTASKGTRRRTRVDAAIWTRACRRTCRTAHGHERRASRRLQEAYDEARAELLGEEKGKRKKSRKGQDEGAEVCPQAAPHLPAAPAGWPPAAATATPPAAAETRLCPIPTLLRCMQGDEEDAFFHSLSVQGRLPAFVELLKFKASKGGGGPSCRQRGGSGSAHAQDRPLLPLLPPAPLLPLPGAAQLPGLPAHWPAAPALASPQSLSVGSKLWGAVVEVRPRELVISLPHGLRGHVGYAAASDTLTELSRKAAKGTPGAADLPPLAALFGLGQLVRCTVVELRQGEPGGAAAGSGKRSGSAGSAAAGGGKGKRVELSLCAARMNADVGESGCAGQSRAAGLPCSGQALRLPGANYSRRLACCSHRLLPPQPAAAAGTRPALGSRCWPPILPPPCSP